jgi:glycosyltransferase involved in cell wall biosynthesis
MISVLILTRNEEADLPGALASVAWSDDVHVFDSLSTDGTVEVARAAGAQVKQRAFDDYASQRNAALEQEFRYPWVFLLDADERVTPELAAEMQRVAAASGPGLAGYKVRRRDFLWGQWLKYAQISPWYVRLVRPERARYSRAVNEVMEVNGEIGALSAPLDHFPFSKGMGHWFRKHDVYSTMEAKLIAGEGGLRAPSLWKALCARDFHVRRVHQKAWFYRMPARPLLKWVYMMVARRAFLDGRAGWTYAALQSVYEYMIVVKTRDLRMAQTRGGAGHGEEGGKKKRIDGGVSPSSEGL